MADGVTCARSLRTALERQTGFYSGPCLNMLSGTWLRAEALLIALGVPAVVTPVSWPSSRVARRRARGRGTTGPADQARVLAGTSLLIYVGCRATFGCAGAGSVAAVLSAAVSVINTATAFTATDPVRQRRRPVALSSEPPGRELASGRILSISYARPVDTYPRSDHGQHGVAIRRGYFTVILVEFVDGMYADSQIDWFVSLSAR